VQGDAPGEQLVGVEFLKTRECKRIKKHNCRIRGPWGTKAQCFQLLVNNRGHWGLWGTGLGRQNMTRSHLQRMLEELRDFVQIKIFRLLPRRDSSTRFVVTAKVCHIFRSCLGSLSGSILAQLEVINIPLPFVHGHYSESS
jgi:hypothetical protein